MSNIVRVTLPYSEVCMSMRVAGKEMNVEVLETGGAQILDENGKPFSFPITLGEAGLSQFARQETFSRALTETELTGILEGIRTEDTPLEAAVLGVFRALDQDFDLRWAIAPSIDPTRYRIPKDQWGTIAEALQGRRGVNAALSFMNFGPSTI
jgi:hypothetical protein